MGEGMIVASRFEVGAVYVATPAIEGQPRRLAVMIGIAGAAVQVAFVDELANGRLEVFSGRDTARLDTRTGRYNISAVVRAEAQDAAIVNDILKSQRRANNGWNESEVADGKRS